MSNLVTFKHNLNTHVIQQDITTMINKLITDIPNIQNLKLDIEITLYIANVVENTVLKKHKINKKELVVGILSNLFSLSPEEQTQIGNQLDFLSNNGKIKAISALKGFGKKLIAWLQKKIL